MSGSAWAASFSCARAGIAGTCVAAIATAVATAMARRARLLALPPLLGEGGVGVLSEMMFPVIENRPCSLRSYQATGLAKLRDACARSTQGCRTWRTNPANAARAGRQPCRTGVPKLPPLHRDRPGRDWGLSARHDCKEPERPRGPPRYASPAPAGPAGGAGLGAQRCAGIHGHGCGCGGGAP